MEKSEVKITADMRQAIALEAQRELARRYYADYLSLVYRGKYQHAKHTRYLCSVIDKIVEAGASGRYIVQMPPQRGKSTTITMALPSYLCGRFPEKRGIIAAYNDDLAQSFSRQNRLKVQEFGGMLFGIRLADDRANLQEWELRGHSGGVAAAGIGGTLSGKAADWLIIDDPIKNDVEAGSPTFRERLKEAYRSVLYPRVHEPGLIIVIQTRWHEDDLAGWLQSQGGWTVVSIPEECDSAEDLLGRQIGEPLWPEKGYTNVWIEQTKLAVGTRVWSCLYQQQPAVQIGTIFKRDWFRYYDKLPDNIECWTQSWDFTFKDATNSDYVAGGVWAKSGANHYLVHRVKERMDFVKSMQRIQQVSGIYSQALRKLVEEKANGAAIISALRSKISGIVAVNPTESKEARASAVAPLFEAGNVWLPRSASWLTDYENELLAFPNGAHDDQVDMTTQYLSRYIIPTRRLGTVGSF